MKDALIARLADAEQRYQQLLQQRARLAELTEQTVAQLNANQGRIAELTELIALADAQAKPKVGGTD